MKVRDVMVRNVVAIEPTASLAEAARRMCEANVGILPVVEAGEVLGVITDRDLVVGASARDTDLVSMPVGRAEAMDLRKRANSDSDARSSLSTARSRPKRSCPHSYEWLARSAWR